MSNTILADRDPRDQEPPTALTDFYAGRAAATAGIPIPKGSSGVFRRAYKRRLAEIAERNVA